jgi:hypothetical protein
MSGSAFARDSRVERLPSPALTQRLLSRPRRRHEDFLADSIRPHGTAAGSAR